MWISVKMFNNNVFFIQDKDEIEVWNKLKSIFKKYNLFDSKAIYEDFINNFGNQISFEEKIIDRIINCSIYFIDEAYINFYNKDYTPIKVKIWWFKKIKGNCVDKFINKKLLSNMSTIQLYIENILSRVKDREISLEYHNTGIYERDFRKICQIRDAAQDIVNDCNKMIEKLSENYTK